MPCARYWPHGQRDRNRWQSRRSCGNRNDSCPTVQCWLCMWCSTRNAAIRMPLTRYSRTLQLRPVIAKSATRFINWLTQPQGGKRRTRVKPTRRGFTFGTDGAVRTCRTFHHARTRNGAKSLDCGDVVHSPEAGFGGEKIAKYRYPY